MSDKIVEEGWILKHNGGILWNEFCQSKSKAEVMCELMAKQYPHMCYKILKVRRTIEVIDE